MFSLNITPHGSDIVNNHINGQLKTKPTAGVVHPCLQSVTFAANRNLFTSDIDLTVLGEGEVHVDIKV